MGVVAMCIKKRHVQTKLREEDDDRERGGGGEKKKEKGIKKIQNNSK